jgi:hypothetical protein
MPSTRGKKKSEYEKQLEKTRKAVQKVKDTKYKAQLEKTGKAVKKVKDTKAVVKQVKKVKKAVQKVKDTKYKAQLEKTGKAVQKVKDTKYKAQLEKTAMAVKKVKDTKAALKPKKKAAPKKKFSDDVSDVETKAPTIKKGTKISATFKEIKEKPKKAKAKFTDQENIEMAERENEDRRAKQKEKAPAKPKKKVAPKKKFIDSLEDNQMNKGVFGLPASYYDLLVNYRNDYPKLAKTEKQMDKLSDYSHRQLNKQLYDHFKLEGDLKTFELKNIYGKAF